MLTLINSTGSDLALVRLLQLVSPGLPIGGFTYSQGLEWAVENGQIRTLDDTLNWLDGLMRENLTNLDLPLLSRLYQAFDSDDFDSINYWSEFLLASRETAELHQEEINRARALSRLLEDLQLPLAEPLKPALNRCHLSGFALASVHWHIPLELCLQGYAWSWLENLAAAAIKLVPLGQTDGQRLQLKMSMLIPAMVEKSQAIDDDSIGSSAPMQAIVSCHHETQYSRLFRS